MNGPFLRITSLKTSEIARKIRDADIPAKQSFFAGSYICNALFYGVLGYAKEQNLNTSIGFIHVPLLDSQDPIGDAIREYGGGGKNCRTGMSCMNNLYIENMY